jgi:myo-inosose-2 dehydratase
MMPVRIGANPIGWSNDDLIEIGGETPLEQCLEEAREAGFEGMELGNKFPREAGRLKEALAPYGLACVGGWHSVELLRRDAKEEFALAKAHRDLLQAMGTNVFIVAETSNAIHGDRAKPLSQRPVLPRGEWKPYTHQMTELAKRLADEGLRLCYHHHMGTIIETREDIARFMDGVGEAVNLLLDTGHATWGGADPAELARTYRGRISHFHAKDVRPDVIAKARAGDWSFLDSILGPGKALGTYTVPGDGAVDYVSVFKEMQGYSGWVIVEAEQDPKKANPLEYARLGVANLKRFLKEAGLS